MKFSGADPEEGTKGVFVPDGVMFTSAINILVLVSYFVHISAVS